MFFLKCLPKRWEERLLKHTETPTHRDTDTFFLVGPTAVGKSAVAQWIAENLDYDILSADSMLVYKGMDIGTAKPEMDERSCIRYYGIDLATPDESFNVWAYIQHARGVLGKAAQAGRKTIVAGGTGLYVKGLTDGLASSSASKPESRAFWTRMLKKDGVEALQEALRRRGAALYESLEDKNNARRLIRALEMTEAGIERPQMTWTQRSKGVPLAGLMLPADQLEMRIESRATEMYRRGFIEEVEDLLRQYSVLSSTARQAIGYAEVMALLDGRCSREEALARTIVRTRQLVKRQKTWFRHQADVKWIEIDVGMRTSRIAELVLNHWRKYGPTRISDQPEVCGKDER